MRSIVFLLPLIFSFLIIVESQDSCTSNLTVTELSTFNIASPICLSPWSDKDFILRYQQTKPGLWTFVLSTPKANAWVGIGFSKTGKMKGASAMVGWQAGNGSSVIKQYYLSGYSSDTVMPDQGNLSLANTTTIVSKSSRLYLAFQLKADTPLSGVIYAVGQDGEIPSSSSNFLLKQHIALISTKMNYTTGKNSTEGLSPASSARPLKMSIGLIMLLMWGTILL